MTLATRSDTTTPARALYVALELSKNTWKLGFAVSRVGKTRIRDVKARDLDAFLREVEEARRHFRLAAGTPTLSCYEAGRDGFWIHRWLTAEGLANVIVDPASIEVSRRKRNAKTDRLDVQKLVRLLARHHEGEDTLRVVRVPPLEAEAERLLPRQLRALKKKRTQWTNRIRAQLFMHGVDLDPRTGFRKQLFLRDLEKAQQWDGAPLPAGLVYMVKLDWEQFSLVERQIRDLEQRQRRALKKARESPAEVTSAQRKAALMTRLCGIGDVSSYLLTTEFFGWREFKNRKELGALAGLTGTPFQSGDSARDQGISKAGNARVRALMVELAWLWLRLQPESRTTLWFHAHVGKSGSRGKRKAIVAVARKLLVELWHFVEHGVVPKGARLKPVQAAQQSRRAVAA